MNRLNVILSIVAAAQAVILIAVVAFGGQKAAAPAKEARFLDLDLANLGRIAAIEVSAPDEKDEKTAKLVRAEKGWTLASADGYPVRANATSSFEASDVDSEVAEALKDDTTAAGAFLKKILGVKVRRPVLVRAENHDAVKVGDQKHERRVTLFDKDGKELAKFYVASGTGSRGVYVRRHGENEVYETSNLSIWDIETGSSRWVDAKFVDLKMEDAVACRLTLAADGGKTFALEKRAEPDPAASQPAATQPAATQPAATQPAATQPAATQPATQPSTQPVKTIDVWYLTEPEVAKADKYAVENVLRAATQLSAAQIVGKTEPAGAGLASPVATVTVRMRDGTEHTLAIGAKRGEDGNDYYVKSSASPWHVLVSKWSLDAVLEAKLEKLKEKPAAAQPAEDHSGHGHEDH